MRSAPRTAPGYCDRSVRPLARSAAATPLVVAGRPLAPTTLRRCGQHEKDVIIVVMLVMLMMIIVPLPLLPLPLLPPPLLVLLLVLVERLLKSSARLNVALTSPMKLIFFLFLVFFCNT